MNAAQADPEERPDEPVVVPITGELDLHAFAPRDVAQVVRDYVAACRERGLRELRLVHGRGQGVQRALVRRVLRELGEHEHGDAPPTAGGWGATCVRLRAAQAHEWPGIPEKTR